MRQGPRGPAEVEQLMNERVLAAVELANAMNFNAEEKRLLLSIPGIGPRVVQRLEQCGIHSLTQLESTGVEQTVRIVEGRLGPSAWGNRRRPLCRALQAIKANAYGRSRGIQRSGDVIAHGANA